MYLVLAPLFKDHRGLVRDCSFVRQPYLGWGAKRPSLPVFFPVISTNVGISPQNFLTFNFNPFATLAYKPRPPFKKSGFSGQIVIKLRL